MAITIRKVTKINQVVILDAHVFDYEQDSPVVVDGAHWWVAYDGDVPVAYAGVKLLEGNLAFLCRAGVLPAWRGKGLQAKLIRARVSWVKKQGMTRAVTYTVLENPPSSNNLIKCGFKLYTPQWKWGGSDALYWFKNL